MMNSNVLSRFRNQADPVAASIYETIKQHDEEYDNSDIEHRAETNAGRHGSFDDFEDAEGQGYVRSAKQTVNDSVPQQIHKQGRSRRRSRDITQKRRLVDVVELDDDVPASLLIEDPNTTIPTTEPSGISSHGQQRQEQRQAQWRQTQAVHRLHSEQQDAPETPTRSGPVNVIGLAAADPREKAMYRWANVENLDNFLGDVYEYYCMHGFWSIVLMRTLNILTVAFVVGMCIFLTQCIDYRKVKGAGEMSDILIGSCTAKMGFLPNLLVWLTTFMCISRVLRHALDIRRLWILHDFYHYLLDIPESEIQSISWQEVVSRLMALRDSNPNIRSTGPLKSNRFMKTQSKQRMDAHDIANRLMRKDNYMIAMINREVLDTTLNIPFLGARQMFTRTLEWHLEYCIMRYVFNDKGEIRQLFLKDLHRKALIEALRSRFIFAGMTSLLFAPFLIIYNLVQNFFKHFNEYQKDPAQLGSRQYTVFAQWKFREFNELEHLFDRRLRMSHPFASRYINQFPRDKTIQTARFVTFVSGAIVSVLGLATVLDQESFLGFEITSGRTTIFYLGVFGSIWAVARGMLPDDNMVYDSSYSMEEVIEFTHYKPAHWDGRLHTVEVKTDFARLYQMQIQIIISEMLSLIFTPFVLCITLPKCSERIIDFFREFTVHVDGLGYVCSFAEFNFKRPGQAGAVANTTTTKGTVTQNPVDAARDAYFSTKDNKLEQSYWGFINDYARNPKTDVRFPYASNMRRRPFHMPPPFPNILSPTLPAGGDDVGHSPNVTKHSVTFSPNLPTGPAGRFMSRNDPASPFQSLLLDPHHQPTMSVPFGNTSPQVLRPKAMHGGKSRLSSSRAAMAITSTLREDDEAITQAQPVDTKLDATKSQPSYEGAGEMGSWKYPEDDDSLSESGEEEGIDQVVGRGAGVLGLIRQLQQAQGGEPRVTGAGV